MSKKQQNDYEFAAQPKVVKPKKKFKEEEEEEEEDQIKFTYNNLMWDKRVVRGNTYAAIVTSKNVEIPHKNTFKQTKNYFKQQEQNKETFNQSAGGQRRTNIQIFTDQFVQTLTDKPPRYQKDCQTEFIIQKPIVRLFMPIKQGVDVQTQIWDDQLFDFDYEVEPLLKVLCGKTLQISRAQVLQQQELKVMKERQEYYHKQAKEQNDKIRAMQSKEAKLKQENDKKIALLKQKKQTMRNSHKKLFSRVVAKQFLKHIKSNTLEVLEGHGVFRNPIQNKLVQTLVPWFYSQTQKQLQNQKNLSNNIVDVLYQVQTDLKKEHNLAIQAEYTRRKKILQKRKQKQREKVERKCMHRQQIQTRRYIQQLKIQVQKEEQQKRLALQKEGNNVEEVKQ